MKKAKFTAIISMAVMMSIPVASLAGNEKQVEIVNENIRYCESTYPYNGGILIANFGTEQLNPLNAEGKGYILYYKNGKMDTLVPADGNLNGPKGMFMRDNQLYICDVNKIVVYDLAQVSKTPKTINLPEGNLFVNDLAANGSDLYVSVTNTDKIFKIDITDPANPGEPQEWITIPGPNGLLIGDGTMYVASYPADGNTSEKHVVYRISDLTNNPQPEKLVTVLGQYDGIAFASDGASLYVTNWTPAGISRINLRNGDLLPVGLSLEESLFGPADITVSDGKIYIPDLPASRVVIISE